MGWGNKKTEKSEYVDANSKTPETGGTATGVQEPSQQTPPKQEAPATPAQGSGGSWKKVEQKVEGNFYKFEREGEELVGIYQGWYCGGKNQWGNDNNNGKILTPEGVALVNMGNPKGNLFRQLTSISEGKRVKIIYHGKKFNKKSGQYYRDFEVFSEE